MDLLDSILKTMEKPPEPSKPKITDEQKEKLEKLQKQKQEYEKKQKKDFAAFKLYIENKIKVFKEKQPSKSEQENKLVLRPMNKIYRSMVYEAAEVYEGDLVVHSFGEEEVDRHCVIWNKGYEPSEEEIRCMKIGVQYIPKRPHEDDDDPSSNKKIATSDQETYGKNRFQEKYEKIIGEKSFGLEAAKIALPADQYGCVPVDLKKDLRSVEQVMDKIRKEKQNKSNSNKEDVAN